MTSPKTREVLSTTKPILVVFTLVVVAVAVVFVGYVLVLAVLAPEQLAEATILATDLICNGCVGTSDIADNAVTSAKIGAGQVGNSDIANNAVTTSKISDTNGVTSVDIVDDAVNSVDIGDAEITAQDIAEGTIRGGNIKDDTIQDADIAPGAISTTVVEKTETVYIDRYHDWLVSAECPDGYFATGGGYRVLFGSATIWSSEPNDTPDAWEVTFRHLSTALDPLIIRVSVVCAA